MSGRRAAAAAALVFMVALCARLVPLQFSELPYNIDGYPLARISEVIIQTGGLPDPAGYDGLLAYNMKLPVFSAVLAMFSLVLGVDPLPLLPYFCALICALSALFIHALARELTRNYLAAFGAGMFAALTGLFVYVTSAAMKQLLAITLLCFILYLYTNRRDWRHRMALAAALALLPFTHHLATLIAMLALSFALVGTAFRRSEHHVRTAREFLLDLAIGPGVLLVSVAYYKASDLEIASQILNVNDAMLLASVAIIMAVAARLLSMTVQTRPWFFLRKREEGICLACVFDEKVLVLAAGIGALYLNSKVHIFTGGTLTSDALLRLMFPYLALAVLALAGFNVMRYAKFPGRHLVVGLFLAPLAMMLFSALKGLDLFGFMIAYRSYNFIDIPLAIAAGVGLAFVVARLREAASRHDFYKPLPAFAVALFVLLCAAALPLAYSNQEAFGVAEVSLPHELDAMRWASESQIDGMATDQRFGDIANPYFGLRVDKTGPWSLKARTLEPGTLVLASEDWTGRGAQMFPFGNVLLTEEGMEAWLDSCDLCYSGGPDGHRMFVAMTR
jgi:hypothetical protein